MELGEFNPGGWLWSDDTLLATAYSPICSNNMFIQSRIAGEVFSEAASKAKSAAISSGR